MKNLTTKSTKDDHKEHKEVAQEGLFFNQENLKIQVRKGMKAIRKMIEEPMMS
jgi:hypothetical protein